VQNEGGRKTNRQVGSSSKTDLKDLLQVVTSSRMVTLVPAYLTVQQDNNKKKKERSEQSCKVYYSG